MKTYDVRVWDLTSRKIRGKTWYRVRWSVGDNPVPFEKLFKTKALADGYRSELISATNAGEPFDSETGRPASEVRATQGAVTFYTNARAYIGMKWPRLSANSRRGTVEALTAITIELVTGKRGRPALSVLREALTMYAFNPRRHEDDMPSEFVAVLAWVEKHSMPLRDVDSVAVVRRVLDSLCVLLDGTPAAANTVQRKRAIFYNVLGYAVELELIGSNPLDRIQWTAPEVAQAVDRRVVANPVQIAALLDALRRLGQRAQRVLAFFALLYYAGTRPSEAANVREADFTLPEAGWGRVILWETAPAAGSQWTDDGQIHDRRGLKHRPAKATRPVPIPPVLVTLIRWHIETFGTTPDGRLFRGIHGGQLSSSIYTRWWKLARVLAFTDAQVSSPLARRPYDLRHAAASLWLNSGVPATEVARRLGHSVKVLLAIYANCVDGGDDGLNDRIDGALNPTPRTGPHGNVAGTPSAEAARVAKQRLVTGKMRSKIARAL